MNVVKVIIGIILIWALGAEYANATIQSGGGWTFLLFLPIALPIVFLISLLIGRGVAGFKFPPKSTLALKFFIGSTLLFFLIAAYSRATYKPTPENVVYNGIKIDIAECQYSNKELIPNAISRKEFCSCLAEKLANETDIHPEYKNALEAGKMISVVKAVQANDPVFLRSLGYCMPDTSK
jgi:hypothetical protein